MRGPDALLVERLHQNDLSAFDALYQNYHLAVYRNILKLTKDPTAAEDILQEVFIRLWEKRKQLDPGQSVAGWLFVISFNLSVDYSRLKLREQVLHRKLFSETQELSADNYWKISEKQYHLLEKAIAQLTPQRRKVVKLCKLQGKTYEEAAVELNISRHTVKEHLSAAMISINEYVRKNSNQGYIAVFLLWLENQ